MLTHPTLDQMVALNLTGMLEAWKGLTEQDPGEALDRNEWLGLMLDRETIFRADKRFANKLRNAASRTPASKMSTSPPVAASTDVISCRSPREAGSGPMSRSSSPGKREPAPHGWPALLDIRLPGSTTPFSMSGCHGFLRTWPWPVLMAVSPDWSTSSPGSSCSFSMIGAPMASLISSGLARTL